MATRASWAYIWMTPLNWPTPITRPKTKLKVNWIICCWDMAIWSSSTKALPESNGNRSWRQGRSDVNITRSFIKMAPALRTIAECIARLSHRLGVCPSVPLSVRPSVTLVSCIKTVQARITKHSPLAAPKTLVYRDKISWLWVRGFPSNEGVKEGQAYP